MWPSMGTEGKERRCVGVVLHRRRPIAKVCLQDRKVHPTEVSDSSYPFEDQV